MTVPQPSNPKKQSLMPASPLRKKLRAAGHHLSPVVQVGKEGFTPAIVAALDAQLLAHELIKVKVGSESPEDRFEVAAGLAALPGAGVVQVIGRVVVLYRHHPYRPRFEPELAQPEPPKPAPKDLKRTRRERGTYGRLSRPPAGRKPREAVRSLREPVRSLREPRPPRGPSGPKAPRERTAPVEPRRERREPRESSERGAPRTQWEPREAKAPRGPKGPRKPWAPRGAKPSRGPKAPRSR